MSAVIHLSHHLFYNVLLTAAVIALLWVLIYLIGAELARYAPVDLKVDLSRLPRSEVTALSRLVEAARIMDALFLRQAWAGNEALLLQLSGDATPLGRARLGALLRNKGPWDRLEEGRALIPGVPAKPPGANFYPAGASKADLERWAAGLSAEQREFVWHSWIAVALWLRRINRNPHRTSRPQLLAHVDASLFALARLHQIVEAEPLIEAIGRRVHHAHAQMRARRAKLAQFFHDHLHHPPAEPAPLRPLQQVVDCGRLRDYFGLNRAKHAVVEAAILATRTAFLSADHIAAEFQRLAVLVEKTGGPMQVTVVFTAPADPATAAAKGNYIRHITVSATMGPGVRVDPNL